MGLAVFTDEDTVLLAEFNHRLFNTFQVISGLLAEFKRLGTSATSPSLRELDGRLIALGTIHRMLAFPPAGTLENHCRTICDLLVKAYGRDDVALGIHMETARLGRREELFVALLVVELVTNVFKHSLAGAGPGAVWVDLQTHRDGFELSVCDNCGAPVGTFEPPRIVQMLARSLHGDVQICDRGGYTAVVRFPGPQTSSLVGSRRRCVTEIYEEIAEVGGHAPRESLEGPV